ncbi:hypothetical protein CRG98_033697 [Punica granatum]|uniref:Uncharacterized protein n=1 Tax=Punica granatum TaxID=22663 RepID=A0A2I0IPH3_PUNGR|nr:hypothetical protein CRG98_033697 [Punica granatum]
MHVEDDVTLGSTLAKRLKNNLCLTPRVQPLGKPYAVSKLRGAPRSSYRCCWKLRLSSPASRKASIQGFFERTTFLGDAKELVSLGADSSVDQLPCHNLMKVSIEMLDSGCGLTLIGT